MTYKLPFGLKQKPVNKKFEHGQIHFSCNDGIMSFEVNYTDKEIMHPVLNGILKTKEQLDYLLNIKEFPIRVNAQMEIVPL